MVPKIPKKLSLLTLSLTLMLGLALNRPNQTIAVEAQITPYQEDVPQDQITTQAKIEPQLLKESEGQEQDEFFIHMSAKADLSPAYLLRTKEEKGQFVFAALRATADNSQSNVRAFLDAQGVAYTFQVMPWTAGYNTQNRTVVLTGNQTENFALQPNLVLCAAPGYLPDYIYLADFEVDDGGFVVDGRLTSWEWGSPSRGPGSALSGLHMPFMFKGSGLNK